VGKYDNPDLGSVVTYIVSPTLAVAVLVREERRRDAQWKLPGGRIEPADGGVIAAAIREVEEETGIRLLPEELTLLYSERRTNGVYFPYFCTASISEEKLDTRLPIADENGKPMRTGVFSRAEIPTMPDLLERHRPFIWEVEGYWPDS